MSCDNSVSAYAQKTLSYPPCPPRGCAGRRIILLRTGRAPGGNYTHAHSFYGVGSRNVVLGDAGFSEIATLFSSACCARAVAIANESVNSLVPRPGYEASRFGACNKKLINSSRLLHTLVEREERRRVRRASGDSKEKNSHKGLANHSHNS